MARLAEVVAPLMGHLLRLFSGSDNQSLDIGRVSWASCHMGVNAATLGLFLTGHPPGLAEFAAAHSGVVVAHATALFAKQQTEPKP